MASEPSFEAQGGDQGGVFAGGVKGVESPEAFLCLIPRDEGENEEHEHGDADGHRGDHGVQGEAETSGGRGGDRSEGPPLIAHVKGDTCE